MIRVLFFLLALPVCVSAQLNGKVVSIADGDTFTMLVNQEQIRVRLHGIDCPEKGQDFANVAKDFLSSMVYAKMVTVKEMGKDRYGRTIGIVQIDSINVNEAMLREGLAWHYKYYDKNPEWAMLENDAREAKKNIWSMPGPVAPWEFRRSQHTRN